MLNLFKQYYPIRNLIFIIGEGFLIILSVLIASLVFLGEECFRVENQILLKSMLITFICQVSIYYNDHIYPRQLKGFKRSRWL